MKLRHLLALVPPGWLVSRADPPVAPPPRLMGAEANHSVSQQDILPFLEAYCFACNGEAKADPSFDRYTDDKSVLADRKVWDTVRHVLKVRETPRRSGRVSCAEVRKPRPASPM